MKKVEIKISTLMKISEALAHFADYDQNKPPDHPGKKAADVYEELLDEIEGDDFPDIE